MNAYVNLIKCILITAIATIVTQKLRMEDQGYELQFSQKCVKCVVIRKDTFQNRSINQTAAVITQKPIAPENEIFYFEIEYEVILLQLL